MIIKVKGVPIQIDEDDRDKFFTKPRLTWHFTTQDYLISTIQIGIKNPETGTIEYSCRLLHRLITNTLDPDMYVIHKNGDKKDYRKANLQVIERKNRNTYWPKQKKEQLYSTQNTTKQPTQINA